MVIIKMLAIALAVFIVFRVVIYRVIVMINPNWCFWHSWIAPFPGMPTYCKYCLRDKDEKAFDRWFETGKRD